MGRRVIVVGGGYAGVSTARRLDGRAEVTLIDRKEAFFHRPAALRAAVDPAWTQSPFISYGSLLQRGEVRTADVTGLDVSARLIQLSSGERLPYDALVLATGARYAEPAQFAGTTVDDAAKALRSHQERIAGAEHVLVVGGGPAGVELAAEIAQAHPVTRVTLAHRGDQLLTGHPPRLGRRAAERLHAHGVQVRLGTRISPGHDIGADLVFMTTGTVPDTDWLRGQPGWLDTQGRLRVDAHLRVGGHNDVFAVGDVTDVNEPKLAQYAVAQGREAAVNVTALLDGKQPAARHKPVTSPMLSIPLGASDGLTQLPLGLIAGGRLTTAVKSRSLLVPYFRKLLGQK